MTKQKKGCGKFFETKELIEFDNICVEGHLCPECSDNQAKGCYDKTGKKSPVMGLNCDGEHWLCPECFDKEKK